MSSLASKIIVGIDFGTTHSGVSWALNEGQKKIRLIADWPNPTAMNANNDKVPSVISYRSGQVENWGYEVGLKDEAFRWVKILLEPESKYAKTTAQVRATNELLGKLNKTAEDVVTDYLRLVWQYTKEDIRKRVEDNAWESAFEVHVVLTVPAMWSHAAKDKTLKAARAAGLPPSIKLVTEPEAAALATLRDKADDNQLRRGDAFVVCDAGGGTVDLISYKVNSVKPLEIEECAIGDGGLCGSVFLNMAFERCIKTLVGEEQYSRIKDIDKKKMLQTFEFGVKRSFSAESTKDYHVDLRGVEDNEDENIRDDTIYLKRSMLKTVFDHVCGQIDNLVQNQVSEVRSNGLQVKAILLVGGFGSSKYLHTRLERTFASDGIRVLQVDGAWSAICRGACMWGLEHQRDGVRPRSPTSGLAALNLTPSRASTSSADGGASSLSSSSSAATTATGGRGTVVSRLSKYSYGVAVTVPFDPTRHLWQDRVFDPSDGEYKATNQMRWLLRRGEKVEEGRILNIRVVSSVHGVGWGSTGSRQFEESLYSCDEKDPPTRLDPERVKQLCNVTFSVPESKIWMEKSYKSAAMQGKWRDMTFVLLVILGNATLGYFVAYQNDLVAGVEATYMEDLA